MKQLSILFFFVCSLLSINLHADEAYNAALKELAAEKIASIVNNAIVQSAIKAQNAKHAGLSEADIIKLDKKWRAENKGSDKPFINATLSNALSGYLSQQKSASDGLFTEMFVMDNKGMNVGQSDITSDYWQGDEAKWQKTYLAGSGAVHIGKLEKDESTQEIQVQLSVAISDSANNVIGAITVGVNLDNL